MIPWYIDATAQFGAGMAISLTDRYFSDNARRKTAGRMERKLEQVRALNFIATAQESSNPGDYVKQVVKAREYFADMGISAEKEQKSFSQRFTEAVKGYATRERINTLSWKKSAALAVGLEFVPDLAVLATSGIVQCEYAVGHSLYQTPALWLGLQAGKLTGYALNAFRSKDEKELDKIGRELTKDGKLLALLRNYSPTANVQAEAKPEEEKGKAGTDYKAIGEKAVETTKDAVVHARDAVSHLLTGIGERIAAHRKAREDAEAARIRAEKEAAERKSQELKKSLEGY